MNVTFLIGNGFDLNLGLATQYPDLSLIHIFSINEARQLLALPAVEDGDKRLQSLNYVTADKEDVYQEVDNHEQTA